MATTLKELTLLSILDLTPRSYLLHLPTNLKQELKTMSDQNCEREASEDFSIYGVPRR